MNRNTMQLIEEDETDTDGEFDDINAKEVRPPRLRKNFITFAG